MRGHNPDWANLPRRKCDDCGKSYKPTQPLREGTRGFCSGNCRKSYHKHGGAYRKLKLEMKRMVDRRLDELAEQMRKLMEPILDDAVSNIVRRELTATVTQMWGKDVADIDAWKRAIQSLSPSLR
jgi:predicted transcriptional regulator